MTVLKSGISWTNSTWNWARGCHAVSEGCAHCYAKTLNDRFAPSSASAAAEQRGTWRPFEQVVVHLDRIADVRKFKPIKGEDGRFSPRLVFVNSMSDWAHDDISDTVLHRVFDAMEYTPHVIYQALTKRVIRARKFLVDRYGSRGLPPNIWIGASVEDNRVAGRLNVMRSIKDRTGGGGTFFVSVEPIIGPTDAVAFDGMDWLIAGGESGAGARIMERRWLSATISASQRLDIPLWYKQAGQIKSHPNLDRAPARLGLHARFDWLVEHGWEKLAFEKGGATIDQLTYRQFPAHYHTLAEAMNAGSAGLL